MLAVAAPDEMCKFILFVVVRCFSWHLSFPLFHALFLLLTQLMKIVLVRKTKCVARECVMLRVYVEFVHI